VRPYFYADGEEVGRQSGLDAAAGIANCYLKSPRGSARSASILQAES
jgi:hypothetical protein